MEMRTKSQSWFVPLIILFAVLWAIGKKDTSTAQVPQSALGMPNTLVSTTPTSLPAAVSADKLNIRDQPGGKLISKLKRGDIVRVYEKRDDWARISMDGDPAK
jgi:uncharacterized protein YgiM (DUF1202 family)